MQDLATFLAGIAAVLVPVAALASEARRRHRAAINETLALAETYRSRDRAVADRFDARALQLANEYLDDAEKQPRTYPRLVTAAALAIGVGVVLLLSADSIEADASSPTAGVARGLVSGALALGTRPLLDDGWNRLRTGTLLLWRRLRRP